MQNDAFFELRDGLFEPQDTARGFWGHDTLGGHVVVGLAGHEVEHRHGEEGLVPVRLNIDMHRLAAFRPVEIATEVVRASRRLLLVEARMKTDGAEFARAQVLFLRGGEMPPGRVWSLPAEAPADPETVDAADLPGQRIWFERRDFEGGVGAHGPRRTWVRELRPMVAGRAITPWARLSAAADFASPWAHSSDVGIQYINCDAILQANRLPVGEWIGLESVLHSASDGIAVGTCRLFDEAGVLGQVSTTGLANQKRKP